MSAFGQQQTLAMQKETRRSGVPLGLTTDGGVFTAALVAQIPRFI
jgi:hypothetical protein